MTGGPPLDVAELYRVLAESASDGIVTIDEHSTILSVNPAAERLFGYSARALIGTRLTRLMPEQFRKAHAQGIARYASSGVRHIPWQGIRLPILTSDGREIPTEISFGEFTSNGRRIFSGIIRDISQQMAAEAALSASNAELRQAAETELRLRREAEEANRAKGEFLAVMSHELRTPLNAIGGYADLMELGLHGPVTEQQLEDLRRMKQSQRHLLGLINQVLNYTRVETGGLHYESTDVRLRDAIAGAEAQVVPQMGGRGLTYDYTECDASLVARADPDKLQQILLNLLTNAIKFTEKGGHIRLSCSAAPNGMVAIAVIDTGVGIAPEKLESVFEPFVQIDQRLTRPHEGVGLGLSISRDLARGMSGDLSAVSTPGVGSTFTLTLPAANRDESSPAPVQSDVVDGAGAPPTT